MYPGNESLSDEIRERILETFRQTLDLAAKGSEQEAQLGCDFVLRLDPLFEPARTLAERLEAGGEIDVEDLRQFVPETTEPEAADERPEADEEPAVEGETPPETSESEPAEAGPTETGPVDLGDTGTADLLADGEPAAALDSETERRIDDLLEEGQAAFEKVRYQEAIDAWSRIFLIDIDHAEANRRIELARKLKAEVERKVEESLHEGITQLELGAFDEAREHFDKVLEMQPGHRQAEEYLARVDARESGEEPEPPAPAPPPPVEPTDPLPPPTAPAEPAEAAEEEAPPPEPPPEAEEAPPSKPRPGRAAGIKPDKRRRLFLMIGSAVLVVVAVAGWLLVSNWDRMFPNAEAPTGQTSGPDPIARAQTLHKQGRTSVAVAQLRRLPPDHPSYAEAQALIADWETPQEVEPAGPDEEQLARFRALLDEAQAAYRDGAYRRAEGLFARAAAITPLEGDPAEQLSNAQGRLAPVAAQLEYFAQGEWEYALRDLWRLHQASPDDRVIRDLMVDCYYNLGVRDLQRGDTVSAESQFQEALGLLRGDAELERLAVFSKTYQERPEDLLYRIFVKYLHFR